MREYHSGFLIYILTQNVECIFFAPFFRQWCARIKLFSLVYKTDATEPLVDHITVSWSVQFGGSGEIRTHGPVTAFSFQDWRIKPLSHTSKFVPMIYYLALGYTTHNCNRSAFSEYLRDDTLYNRFRSASFILLRLSMKLSLDQSRSVSKSGWHGRDRTYDQTINSRRLYRWATCQKLST